MLRRKFLAKIGHVVHRRLKFSSSFLKESAKHKKGAQKRKEKR